jgi:hypothetical protein
MMADTTGKKITNSKPIPHIPLPFREVMADVLKVKPPTKPLKPPRPTRATRRNDSRGGTGTRKMGRG